MDYIELPTYIEQALKELTEHQLYLLDEKVAERLKFFQQARNLQSMTRFSVLDKVMFEHYGEKIIGTVTRLNQRTVTIKTDKGGWKVSPSLLTKIINAASPRGTYFKK